MRETYVLDHLIARVAMGDRQAFSDLYAATSAKLFGVCLRILRDRAESEDALQEVYIRIWQKADRFGALGYHPMTWLITVARNMAIDRLRARKPTAAGSDVLDTIPDTGQTPEQAAINSAQRAQIGLCLDQLEPSRANAVRGAYLAGYSYNDLAARYDVPLNTMRTWLRRSLQKLKECLST